MKGIIGPQTAQGWIAQFGTANMYPSFATGPGTAFPFPSVPIAQIFRWWWAVKSWSVDIDVTQTVSGVPTTHTLSTGLIPFGCGMDTPGVLVPRNSNYEAWVGGDSGTYPARSNRYEPTYGGGPGGLFLGGFFPLLFAGVQAPNPVFPFSLSSIFDNDTPGNAFSSFMLLGGIGSFQFERTDGSGEDYTETDVTCTLDGMDTPTYWDRDPASSDTAVGTIIVNTSEEEPDITE